MIHAFNQWLWGTPLVLILCLASLFLTWRLRAVQFRYFYLSHKLAFAPHRGKTQGDVSQFEAFSTSLASSIGIGSIAGVAVAVVDGGLGALFWMWVVALLGMPLKYTESHLALKYREKDANKEMCGGPMLYLEKGLKSKKLAIGYAVLVILSSFGIGNLVQAQAISETLAATCGLSPLVSGIGLAIIVGCVIMGGIQSIGRVASILVPVMGLIFVGAALAILLINYQHLGSAFVSIVTAAFQTKSLLLGLTMGAAQGIFSSEAGLGVAGIAASSAKVASRHEQSLIQMSTVSITTLFVCTLSGLVIATTGVLESNFTGAKLLLQAFKQNLPFGQYLLLAVILPFGYSTIIAWAYYAERGLDYLLKAKFLKIFRAIFTLAIVFGSLLSLQVVWDYAHLANGLMIIPNLVGVVGLSGLVAKEQRY